MNNCTYRSENLDEQIPQNTQTAIQYVVVIMAYKEMEFVTEN